MNKHATVQDLAAETRDLLSHCGVAELSSPPAKA